MIDPSTVFEFVRDKSFILAVFPVAVLVVFFVHELGHYVAAKMAGMRVESVSLGIGKEIWRWTDRGGTVWHVRLFPVAAHVHVEGYMDDGRYSYRCRMGVVLAGPLANMVLPFFLFFFYFLWAGMPVQPPVVTAVEIDQPAYQAGLRPGDRVLRIDGDSVDDMRSIMRHTRPRSDSPRVFELVRDGEEMTLEMVSVWEEYRDRRGVTHAHGRVGFLVLHRPFQMESVESIDGTNVQDWDNAAIAALLQEHMGRESVMHILSADRTYRPFLFVLDADLNAHLNPYDPDHEYADRFFPGTLPDNIYRPLGLAQSLQESLRVTGKMYQGVLRVPVQLFPIDREGLRPDVVVSVDTSWIKNMAYRVLYVIATLSVAIAFINLLPLPGLDGSVMLLETAKHLKKRTLSNREKALLITGALVLLYGLVLLANFGNLQGYIGFLLEGDP